MGSQRAGHDLATKQQQGRIKWYKEEEKLLWHWVACSKIDCCYDYHLPQVLKDWYLVLPVEKKKKKSCPSSRTSVPSCPCSLICHSSPFPNQCDCVCAPSLLTGQSDTHPPLPCHPGASHNLWAWVTTVASLFVNSMSELEAPWGQVLSFLHKAGYAFSKCPQDWMNEWISIHPKPSIFLFWQQDWWMKD